MGVRGCGCLVGAESDPGLTAATTWSGTGCALINPTPWKVSSFEDNQDALSVLWGSGCRVSGPGLFRLG